VEVFQKTVIKEKFARPSGGQMLRQSRLSTTRPPNAAFVKIFVHAIRLKVGDSL